MAHILREAWLTQAIEIMRTDLFAPKGFTVPDDVRISMGWPNKRKAIGECWHGSASADGTREIFISPALTDPVVILGTVAHELCHACLPDKTGHRKPFQKMAESIGLLAPWTATTEGGEFRAWTRDAIEKLGEYPHAALNRNAVKKQTTRMIRCACTACEDEGAPFIVRMSQKTITTHGTPICPIHSIGLEV